jgi:hypothetical protein
MLDVLAPEEHERYRETLSDEQHRTGRHPALNAWRHRRADGPGSL